ncbi:MAG: hypothetical protein Kow0031_01130 [Anaerolineae bacterium]
MDDKLTELMKILQPDDPHQLTPFDLARLHELIRENRISAEHLSALYLAQPETARLQVASQQKISDAAAAMLEAAAEGQARSLAALHGAMTDMIQAMSNLADQVGDNPTAAAALADISVRFSETADRLADRLETVNRHNNQTWSRIVATTAISGGGGATMAAAYLLNREVR